MKKLNNMKALITFLLFLFTFTGCKIPEHVIKTEPNRTIISENCFIINSSKENSLIISDVQSEKNLKEIIYNIHCDKIHSIFCKPKTSVEYKKQIQMLRDILHKHQEEMKYLRNNPTAFKFEDRTIFEN